ncbi:MAG: dihydrolipoyl dehydrogenase [Proteobacteria bacterium]|nr:dihydrolipoyl dehydrogenase [Pseudomonadota bacterium]
MAEQFDVCIIGGGPGGYVAAIRASQLKMKVALVEAKHLGGICLNWGCIPTKALLRASEINHLLNHADQFGFSIKGATFDFKKVIQRSRDVSAQLTKGVAGLMKKNKITVIEGYGKLNGKGKVLVKESTDRDSKKIADIEAKHIIIATGARARSLPGLEPDGKLVWTYKEAMLPDAMPKSLLVVGSGAIGTEFASFYHNMGVDVTLVEVMDRILPVEDEEISKLAKKFFEAQGLKIEVGTTVTALKKSKNNVTATLKGKDGKSKELTVDRVIMAVGIIGNTENLGLEGTGVKVEKNQILTNEWCETGEKGVYAIGDVAGAPWLAHKASHEGVICVEKISGDTHVKPMKKHLIPGCTYTRPQVASIGLTEAKAKEKGHEVKVGRFPFIGNGKAIAMGETDGLIKTVFDAKTGELLGAHMIGAEVTEMIQGYGIAMGMEATEAELMHTIFAHPTMSEMMHESVLDAFGRVLHM